MVFAANGPMAQGLAAQGPVAQRHTKGPRRPKNGPSRAQRNPEKVQEGTGARKSLGRPRALRVWMIICIMQLTIVNHEAPRDLL